MDNRSSFSAVPRAAAPLGFGSTIPSGTELPVDRFHDSFTVDGAITIQRLTALPRGQVVWLYFTGAPLVTAGSWLLCPNNANIQIAAGDALIVRSQGDGIWCVLDYLPAATAKLLASNNLSDLASTATALQNLGIDPNLRQNNILSYIYQSKAFAGYRRLVNIFADGYKASDGVAAGSSSNYTVSTSAGTVAPAAIVTNNGSDPPASTATTGWINSTWIPEYATIPNSETVTSIGMYADAAVTLQMKIIKRNSSSNVDVLVSQGFTHPGGGWADCVLTTPFRVPASGSYYVGAFFNSDASIKYNVTAGSRMHTASNITGLSQTVTEDSAGGGVPSFRSSTANNATIVTTAQTADASVSNGRVLIEHDNGDAPVAGTDFTIEASCNGGTNWTAASTYNVVTSNSQGGRRVIETNDIACTAGTSFQARIKTFNNKSVPIYGTSLVVH